MHIVQRIIINTLTALYQSFWYAILSAVLLCFLYLYAYHPINSGKGLKATFKVWIKGFKTSVFFRKLFLLFFFAVMILWKRFMEIAERKTKYEQSNA